MKEKDRAEEYRKEILELVGKIRQAENLKRAYKLLAYLYLREK